MNIKNIIMKNSNTPIFILKPRFSSIDIIIDTIKLWGSFVISMIVVYVFSIFIFNILLSNTSDLKDILFYVIAALIIISPFIFYALKARSSSAIEYRIFNDHFEFNKGFITTKNKSVHYLSIVSFELKKGILMKQRNLGNILITTVPTGNEIEYLDPEMGVRNSTASNIIKLRLLENSDQVYQKLNELVNSFKANVTNK